MCIYNGKTFFMKKICLKCEEITKSRSPFTEKQKNSKFHYSFILLCENTIKITR